MIARLPAQQTAHSKSVDPSEDYGRPALEQKPNLRGLAEMVRGGFFLRKKPLGDSASHYTNSAFAINGRGLVRSCNIESDRVAAHSP